MTNVFFSENIKIETSIASHLEKFQPTSRFFRLIILNNNSIMTLGANAMETLETLDLQPRRFLACSKRSRTRLAPMPAKISTNSEAEMLKKGTPASAGRNPLG